MVKMMRPVTRSSMLTGMLALMGIVLLIGLPSSGCLGTRTNIRVESNPRASDDLAVHARVRDAYGKLPLSFEANQGQTDAQVKFLARGRGYRLFLTATEAVLTLLKTEGTSRNREPVRPAVAGASTSVGPSATTGGTDRWHTLRMQLVGANPRPRMAGEEPLPGTVNYFIGDDPHQWRRNVPTYAKVKYEEVYPGVDVVYYGNPRHLEYDWIVAAGADPNRIRLRFAGAEKLDVDAEGNLILQTVGGELMQRAPVIYQEVGGQKQRVAGRYALVERGDSDDRTPEVGFEVGSYDGSRPLVIDPVLVYSTYLGGSGQDFAFGIAVDAAGNAYVTGQTTSANFPTANPVQPVNGGAFDAFVAMLDPTGSALVYSTYLGGSFNDLGRGIAVDAAGNAYVTGETASTNFPTANPVQPAHGGGPTGTSDAFVAMLDPAGSALVYSTYLGGSGGDGGYGIAVDASGNAYVTGDTGSLNFPTANPLQPVNRGPSDAFVAMLDPAGSALVYSTYLGGSSDDQGLGIAVDAAGNACVTGRTISTNFPTANPVQPANGGGFDAFVAMLDPAGSALVYSTYLGGTSHDEGLGIAVDAAGNAYVTGSTSSTNFPTANPVQPVNRGSFDAFVAMLDPSGSALVYSTYLGGGGFDEGLGIAVDAAGNAYVTGDTGSLNFPTANPVQPAYGGSRDAFVATLDPAGSALVYSTYLGGSGVDVGFGIAVDAAGNAYVTGDTTSINFPTANPLQPVNRGSFDAFIAKIAP